jgi:hypothetical protein
VEILRNLDKFDPEADKPVFYYLNAIDVARIIGRSYSGVTRKDRRHYPKLVASFVYLITFIDGWKLDYTNRYIASVAGLKYKTEVTKYRNKHIEYWNSAESSRYRMRIQLALEAMRKRDNIKGARYKQEPFEIEET